MRTRLLLTLFPLLGACAGPLPQPDPAKAWVELYTLPANTLLAQRLDGQTVYDGRYFEVTPGKHELELRFQYEVPAGGGGANMLDGSSELTCRVWLTYDDFRAGQRYRLELRPQLRSALALLTDASGTLVAKTDFQGKVNCNYF